jgi:hypothetical protein
MQILGETRVLTASEAHGPAHAFVGPEMTPRVVSSGPGGCMGFAAVPDHDDAFFMISRFYPIFKGESAGIELLRSQSGFEEPWRSDRVIDLPMVHRIASASTSQGDYVFGASVCGGKEYQDDWSQAGAVYACRIPDELDGSWNAEPILNGIHKNHGMTITKIGGIDCLVVSGEEGVMAISLPEPDSDGRSEAWTARTLVDHEVSEIQFIDIDGDGTDELAVIEPFHGDGLSIYKQQNGAWNRVFSDTIGFGHGLSAGWIGGLPCITVGQRGGDKNLRCYSPAAEGSLRMELTIVDRGTGTLGTVFVSTPDGDGIVASNAEPSEYALYTVGS